VGIPPSRGAWPPSVVPSACIGVQPSSWRLAYFPPRPQHDSIPRSFQGGLGIFPAPCGHPLSFRIYRQRYKLIWRRERRRSPWGFGRNGICVQCMQRRRRVLHSMSTSYHVLCTYSFLFLLPFLRVYMCSPMYDSAHATPPFLVICMHCYTMTILHVSHMVRVCVHHELVLLASQARMCGRHAQAYVRNIRLWLVVALQGRYKIPYL